MAFPDLVDIRNRVRSLMNEDSNSMFLTDAILNRFINDGERDIAIKTGCIENIDSVTTTASSRLVQFSGHKIKYMEYVPPSGSRLGVQKITLKHLGRVPVNGSIPQYWCQFGGNAVIHPIPDSAYTLYIYVSDYPHTEMSEDTDEPTIPSAYHEDIVQYALSRSLMRDRKWLHAAFAYNKYIKSIQAKKYLLTTQHPDTRIGIKIPDVVKGAEK